jgi:hypothetical protein
MNGDEDTKMYLELRVLKTEIVANNQIHNDPLDLARFSLRLIKLSITIPPMVDGSASRIPKGVFE